MDFDVNRLQEIREKAIRDSKELHETICKEFGPMPPPFKHGVVELAETSYGSIVTEDQQRIRQLEQRVDELEATKWKQSSEIIMTRLIAIIALAAGVLALIIS